eukprot:gene788-9038_t
MKKKNSLNQKKKKEKKFTEITVPNITIFDETEVPSTPTKTEIPSSSKIFSDSEKDEPSTPIRGALRFDVSPTGSPIPPSPNFMSYLRNIDVMHINDDTEAEISEEEEKEKEEYDRVYNFIYIPFEVEKFLFFGIILCFDSFLYYFTYFPIRLFFTFMKLIFTKFKLRNSQIIDFTKFLVIFINCILMYFFLDYSKSYHWVRGESALKLYVFYNMLEVMERLCCSFGEDIQSALHKTIIQKKSFHIFFIFIINTVYLCMLNFYHFLKLLDIHSVVNYYRIITLNVALNSDQNSLVVLLISNNFVEIKGGVFKKFQNDKLFQILCRDIVDRFEIFFYGFVIAIQNMKHAVFGFGEFQSILLVLAAEILTDYIKHAFIAKYNNVESSMFQDFKYVLCEDIILHKEEKRSSKKRIGFVPLPYVCFTLVRLIFKFLPHSVPLNSLMSVLAYILGFVVLFLLKVFLSLVISGYSARKLKYGKKTNQYDDVFRYQMRGTQIF